MALLVAATGLLCDWPFEVAEAKSMVHEDEKRAAESLSERLSSEWREFLARAGLWDDPSGRWTRELIEKRAGQQVQVSLSLTDASLVRLVIRATFTEFKDNWGEFCIVGTGALHWYPVGPAELDRLAERFAGDPQ